MWTRVGYVHIRNLGQTVAILILTVYYLIISASLEMGIQMIALNSQYGDEYSCLMRAFFQRTANKCSGYRIRPPLSPLPPFKPT